jgi:nucleotide-binding universal stress UspA family protein
MISKILVAMDGSEVAKKSVEYAAEFARQFGASIIMLTVIDRRFMIPQVAPDIVVPSLPVEPMEGYFRHMAESYLEEAEKICREKGLTGKKVIRTGHPVEEIIGEAEASGVDLIILGSHGKSALKAALLGSVTFGVIHKDTRIPVLIVRR